MTNIFKIAPTVTAITVVILGIAIQPAAAQQMGRDGYNFPARSASLSAQFQFQRNMSASAQSNAAGLGALTQYSTVYNSTSTAIANQNSVTQNLSGGATGSVHTLGNQDSAGDQGATATTDVAVDNSVENAGNLTEILAPTVPATPE
ncbi:MAG: hypothetical protein WD075_06255 [Rhodospirillales bacterium]